MKIDMKKMRLICVLMFSLILLSAAASPIVRADVNDDIRVRDARGEKVTFDSPPERIVSFMASNTEILFHLGLGERVVGVDKYSNYPPETDDIPKVGDAFNVDYEKIVSLDPDVVVISLANTNMIPSLEQYDLKVVVTGGTKIKDVYSDIRILGNMCGIEKKADDIADDLKMTMDEMTDETRELPKEKRPRVFYIAGTYQGIYTPGKNTFQNSLITRGGGNNIASDKENWTTISEEEIIADDPEIIIAPDSLKGSVKELIKKDSWEDIEAVKEEQIFYVNGDIMSRPGPRIVDAQIRLVNLFKVVRSGAESPDLLINKIICSPSRMINNGTQANISAEVENTGQLDAINVDISFWYSSVNSTIKTHIKSTTINIIEDKTTITTERFRWKYPQKGKYTITAEVDVNNETDEINENNNQLSTEVIVKEENKNDETPAFSTAAFIAAIIVIIFMKIREE